MQATEIETLKGLGDSTKMVELEISSLDGIFK